MDALIKDLRQKLSRRAEAHLLRSRLSTQGPMGPSVSIEGSDFLCFSSNDYLGHANHPKIQEALIQSSRQFGVGGGASHVVCGHHYAHQQLEETFAYRLNRDKAVFFTNGYMANLAVITSLLDKKDAVFEDKWNHASLLDGGLMSGARFHRFLHNDVLDLERKLKKNQSRHKMICADSVFSMDGDLSDISGILPIAKQYDALFMLDDAHGFGVLGSNGLGIIEHSQLSQNDLPLVMITLGKALGTFGAIVAGHETLIDNIIQFARPYIYTTSLPPCIASAAEASLHLLDEEGWRREHLKHLIMYFKKEATLLNLPLMESNTAIQPLVIGNEEDAMRWQAELKKQHILVNAIRPPTVPRGTSRLRITLTAAHTIDHVEQLLSALSHISKKNCYESASHKYDSEFIL